MSPAGLARDWSTIPVEDLGGGVSRQMVVGDRLHVCRLRFAPHVVTTPHDHPHEQMTIVERGRVRFIIGKEEREVGPGTVLHFPSGVWHGATMLDEEVVLLDIFTPVREDFLGSGEDTVKAFDLTGKTALVTGASRGIGAAMAVGLAEAGADVVVHGNSRSPEDTCRAVEAAGRRAFPITADLADPAGSRDLVERAIALAGRLDVLVNNAGIIRRAPAAEMSDEDWAAVIEVDLSAVFRCARAMGKQLLAAGRPGKIVNVASLLSFQGGITVPGYAAAKGGVAQLTKALANEWAGRGINVNAIAPGYIRTDNTEPLQKDAVRSGQILARIPAGRWGEAEDLSGAVVFLASSASDFVHGHVLVVDGGWMGR